MKDQDYLNGALVVAVKTGDTEKVRLLLSEGADIKSHYDLELSRVMGRGRTPYPRELVKVLLEAGAAMGSCSTPNAAVRQRDKEMLQLIAKAGSNDLLGSALVHLAAEADVEGVDLLLQTGADPNGSITVSLSDNDYGYHHSNITALEAVIYPYEVHSSGGRDSSREPADLPSREQFARQATIRVKVLQLLLDAGADVNHLSEGPHRLNGTQKTPLDGALSVAQLVPTLFELAEVLHSYGGKTASALLAEQKQNTIHTHATPSQSTFNKVDTTRPKRRRSFWRFWEL